MFNVLKRKWQFYKDKQIHPIAISLYLSLQAIGWLLFRFESLAWQHVLKNHRYYFPNIAFKTISFSNLIRYPIQILWLCLIKPKTKKTTRLKRLLWLVTNRLGHILKFFKSSSNYLHQQIKNASKPIVNLGLFNLNQPIFLSIILLCSIGIILLCTARYFSVKEQLTFAFIIWAVAFFIRNIPGQFTQLILTLMSVIASSRYLWWRYSETLVWHDLQSEIFGSLLIGAETYVTLVLILGYFQSISLLDRKPVSLPKTIDSWPSVDVMFTTYNESLEILKLGIYGALAMDWPKEKLNIYILDDGCREPIKRFAEEVGVNYIERKSSLHAKAGNINHALQKTHSEYIVFFDCDYIPTRAFLQLTVGCFLKNKKLAFLQTPHHFFSEDPFEKNLNPSYQVPNESHLFYDIVQNGNDTWNATYFCGSSGVFRREAMEAIGGMATYSVTEDALTSIKLHEKGYESAYIRIPLAAGLATDSISIHIGQRIRWARGMVQILRMERPLFNTKLTLPQRLCYFNAILHFLSGLPRLIFLTIPFAYLVLNANIFYATPWMVFLYIAPHLIHATLANGRIQAEHRHFLWNELYETIMSYYITWPALFALFDPKHGSFNVTAKGGLIKQKFADWKIATPYLIILLINVIGFIIGILKLTVFGAESPLTIALNLFWVTYNLAILGGVLGVIIEEKQVRAFPRVECNISVYLKRANGYLIPCQMQNFSPTGVSLESLSPIVLNTKERVELILTRDNEEFSFESVVQRNRLNKIALKLNPLSHQKYVQYIQCTFSRADIWAKYRKHFKKQSTLRSFKEILKLSRTGYYEAINFAPPLTQLCIKKFIKAGSYVWSFLPKRPLEKTIS